MKNVTFKLETLTCPSCVNKIEKAVASTKGVEEVNVLFNASKVKVQYNEEIVDSISIKRSIERVGYDVLSESTR